MKQQADAADGGRRGAGGGGGPGGIVEQVLDAAHQIAVVCSRRTLPQRHLQTRKA